MIKIVIDEKVASSSEVALYLADCIKSGRKSVSVVSLAQALVEQQDVGVPVESDVSVISLTPQYRPANKEKVVYWLDEASTNLGSEVQSPFVRFKHLFMGAMGIGALKGYRVFVDSLYLKKRLSANVANVAVLPFPLTYKARDLPGEYGPIVAVEINTATGVSDDELFAILCAIGKPGIEKLLIYSSAPTVLERVRSLGASVQLSLSMTSDFDAFVAVLSGSMLYVGVGLTSGISYQRLSLAASLLRPVLFYDSSIDKSYFVNEVTGFDTDDIETLGNVVGMFVIRELDAQFFGESLYLYLTRKYCPDNVLLEALQ